jgi:ATP-binding cassette subfamily B protein
MLAVLWFGGSFVMQGRLSLGEFTAFNIWITMLIMPMRMMGWSVSSAIRATAAAKRVYAIQDERPDLTSPADPVPIGRVNGEIEFQDVTFSYNGSRPVVDGVTLRIAPGETVGVLGGVGSGKSTLAALVPRFYDPEQGSVRIDGHDVRDLDLRELRSQIGFVFQDSFLFSGTVRENIAFGKPDASDEEVREAARQAAILDFIESLDAGFDTPIGERGMRLSGGQQQRIAIARALLTDPRILILDSCTSSVDTYTEHLIQQALDKLMKGRTTIVIAHRASSVAGADRVVVLDHGRIVQEGTPEELAQETEGLFIQLDRLQHDLEGLEVA